MIRLLLFAASVPALVAVLWLVDWAAGTDKALPVAAVVLLAGLLVDFGASRPRKRVAR